MLTRITNINQQLINAAREPRENIDAVRTLLSEKGIDVNYLTSPSRFTALSWAATHGHKTIVLTLLKHGAKIYIPDYKGATALTEAAENGHSEIVRTLLQHDPSGINHPDKTNYTALMRAVCRGHIEVVQELLLYPVDIHSPKTLLGNHSAFSMAVENSLKLNGLPTSKEILALIKTYDEKEKKSSFSKSQITLFKTIPIPPKIAGIINDFFNEKEKESSFSKSHTTFFSTIHQFPSNVTDIIDEYTKPIRKIITNV